MVHRDTGHLDPVTEEVPYGWVKRPGPEPSPRRRMFRRGWQDAMYAAIALFFASLSLPCLVLAWRLSGGHP